MVRARTGDRTVVGLVRGDLMTHDLYILCSKSIIQAYCNAESLPSVLYDEKKS